MRFFGPSSENPGPYDEISLKPGSYTSFPTIPLKKYAAAGGHEISRFEPQMVVDPVGGVKIGSYGDFLVRGVCRV